MLIDSHCHLDFPDFDEDRDALITRAHEAGVTHMITISTRVKQFETLTKLTDSYDNVFCSVGTHPHNAAEEPDITCEDLIRLSHHPKCVAIGEAGLDYYYDNAPRDQQAKSFREHIKASRETRLPLVIHSRDADDDMISVLEEETNKGPFPAILHCFSSGRELAMRGLELGLYISFSGIVTFKNAKALQNIAKEVPLDRLLVETDAPYLAPTPRRGQRNEPAFVKHTADYLADLRGMDSDSLSEATTQNCLKIFGKISHSMSLTQKTKE